MERCSAKRICAARVSGLVVISAAWLCACGPAQLGEGSSGEGESESETGAPPDLPPPAPPDSCVELDGVFDYAGHRLCAVTATGLVSYVDGETLETVIERLDGLDERVELGRYALGDRCGFLVHAPAADRIWLSDSDANHVPEDFGFETFELHVLDGAGALLDTVALRLGDADLYSLRATVAGDRLALVGAKGGEGQRGSVVQLRDADGAPLWTREDLPSADSVETTDYLWYPVASDTQLAFVAGVLYTDSYRMSFHVVDLVDGALAWEELLDEDDLGHRFFPGAGQSASGEPQIYLSQIESEGVGDDLVTLRAHDPSGGAQWMQALAWPDGTNPWATGARASGSGLYELIWAEGAAEFVHRELDGELRCRSTLDEQLLPGFSDLQLHGPTRALVPLRGWPGAADEELHQVRVLRVGWPGE